METLGPFTLKGLCRVIWGYILRFYRDDGKEIGDYYTLIGNMLGL